MSGNWGAISRICILSLWKHAAGVYDTLVLFLVPIFGQEYLWSRQDDASRYWFLSSVFKRPVGIAELVNILVSCFLLPWCGFKRIQIQSSKGGSEDLGTKLWNSQCLQKPWTIVGLWRYCDLVKPWIGRERVSGHLERKAVHILINPQYLLNYQSKGRTRWLHSWLFVIDFMWPNKRVDLAEDPLHMLLPVLTPLARIENLHCSHWDSTHLHCNVPCSRFIVSIRKRHRQDYARSQALWLLLHHAI